LGLPVNLILRVLNGLQFMYVGNNVMLLGHVIAFFSIFISVGLDLKIQGLVFFFLASPLFVNLLYSIYFFTKNSSMAPIFSKFNPSTLLELVQVGAWTVLSQLIYALKINAPVLIISSTLGLVVLAEFSIAHKLVTIITVIANIGLQSLWPIYGEAYSSGGKLWIINTMRKSVFYAVSLSLFFSFFIVVFGDDIFKLWIHDYNPPSTSLMVSLVFLTSLMNINVCFAVFLNGTGHFKNQSIYYSFFVFLGIVGSILFSSEYGSISVVLSMAVFTELLSIPFFYNNYKKVLSKI
jgi:O-antigen/teichoic acid export membrane protein